MNGMANGECLRFSKKKGCKIPLSNGISNVYVELITTFLTFLMLAYCCILLHFLLHFVAFCCMFDTELCTKQMLLLNSEHKIPGQAKPSCVPKYVTKLKQYHNIVTAHNYVDNTVYHPAI